MDKLNCELKIRKLSTSVFFLTILISDQFPIVGYMAQMGLAKKLLPLLDRVLVQKAEVVTKTEGGIVIPEKSQGKINKVHHGVVVAVGPGARNNQGEIIPPSVQVGDKVLLPEYGGTKVELGDKEEYHLFRESSLLAKIEKKD